MGGPSSSGGLWGGEGLHELNLGWGGVNATSSPSVFPLWLRLGSFWTEDSHPGTGRDPLLPALRPRQGHPPTVGCRRFVSPPSVPEAFLSPQWGLRGLDGGGVDPAPGLAGSRDGGRGSGVPGRGAGWAGSSGSPPPPPACPCGAGPSVRKRSPSAALVRCLSPWGGGQAGAPFSFVSAWTSP